MKLYSDYADKIGYGASQKGNRHFDVYWQVRRASKNVAGTRRTLCRTTCRSERNYGCDTLRLGKSPLHSRYRTAPTSCRSPRNQGSDTLARSIKKEFSIILGKFLNPPLTGFRKYPKISPVNVTRNIQITQRPALPPCNVNKIQNGTSGFLRKRREGNMNAELIELLREILAELKNQREVLEQIRDKKSDYGFD